MSIIRKEYKVYRTPNKVTEPSNFQFGLITRAPNLCLIDIETEFEAPAGCTYLYNVVNDTVTKIDEIPGKGKYVACPVIAGECKHIFTSFVGTQIFLCVMLCPKDMLKPILDMVIALNLTEHEYKHIYWQTDRTVEENLSAVQFQLQKIELRQSEKRKNGTTETSTSKDTVTTPQCTVS